MKKMNKMRFLAKTIISSFVLLAIFTACEVGLGSNVDTAAPKIEILSPEPSSTHKGEFQITGTASDEIAVRSVSVNLLENGTARYSYNANYDAASGKWSVSIPTLDENNKPIVEDLKYEIQVIATDTDGKTSVATRSVQVDNSAPTVLVNSPSLFNDNKSTFFRQLRVSGSAYDASEISSVKVYFYSMEDFQDGTSFDYALTDKYVVYNAEGTNTWNLTVDLLQNDVFFENGKVYHFFVIAEDTAGNKNTYFYRMGDFYRDEVISDTTPDDSDNYIPFPSMVQIGKFDQGLPVENPTSGLTAEGLERIRKECSAIESNDSNFLYRSEAASNVSWGNIVSVETKNENGQIEIGPRAIPLGTDVTGQIKSTDGTTVMQDEVEFWLSDMDDENKVWKIRQNNIKLDTSETTTIFTVTLHDKIEEDISDTEELPPLKSGNYKIEVKYKTVASQNSDKLSAEQIFGVSAGMPKLTETKLTGKDPSPINVQKYSNESVSLGGIAVKGDGNPINEIETTYNGQKISFPGTIYDGIWELEISEEGSHTYEFKVTDAGTSSSLNRTVIIDKTAPKIENMSFYQSADKKTVTISALVTDENSFEKIEYAFVEGKIESETELAEDVWKEAEKKNSLNIELVASDFGSLEFQQGPWTMWIKVSDPAGNEKIEKYSGILDLEAPEFSNNFKTTTIPENGYLNKDFYYVDSELSEDIVIATDNNEISKIEIVAKKDGKVTDTLSATQIINKKELKKSDVINLPVIKAISENEGKWIITFTLYDLNNNKVEKTVDFSMDVTSPKGEITVLPSPKSDKGKVEFGGTASDTLSGIDKVVIKYEDKEIECAGGTSWRGELDISKEGKDTVYAIIYDRAGNKFETNREFNIDFNNPTLTINSKTEVQTNETKYILSGTAEDSLAIEKIEITATKNGKIQTGDDESDESDGIWKTFTDVTDETTIDIPGNTNLLPSEDPEGKWIFTIKAYDKVGRVSEPSIINILVDRGAPVFKEAKITSDSTEIEGKTWYKGQTIKLEGQLTEGNGIESIEYFIGEANGVSCGYKIEGDTYNFSANIPVDPDLAEAEQITIRAIDTFGNEDDYTVENVYVDIGNPTIEILDDVSNIFLKENDNLKVKLKATDDESGVASVKARFNRSESYDDIKVEPTSEEFEFEISSDKIKGETVYLQVEDNCGNTFETSFQFRRDIDSPTVAITSHSDGDTVNGKITLSGTTTESQGLAKVEIFVNGSDTASKIFEGNKGFNWSWDINTEDYDNEAGTLLIKVVATDNAGNDSEPKEPKEPQEITLKIDQKSDRPVITINNTPEEGNFINTNSIFGSITDDDGQITEIKVSKEKIDSVDGWADISTTDFGNGVFVYTLAEKDGSKELWFYIKDAGGKEFITSSVDADASNAPVIKYGDSKNTKPLSFNLNIERPVINSAKVAYTDSTETAFETGLKVGGANKTFDILVNATDGNGIQAVSLKAGEKTISDVYNADENGIWKIPVDTELPEGDVEFKLPEGDVEFEITVTDKAGSSSTLAKTLLVDNTSPSIIIESHTKSEDMQVTGSVRLSGNVSDDKEIDGNKIATSGVASLQWLIPTIAEQNKSNEEIKKLTTWKDVVGISSWSYTFENDSEKEITEELSNYANSTYGIEESIGKNIWKLPIYLLATDSVGNQTLKTDFVLYVDPDGDNPKADISYPTNDLILGGTIRVNGTAEDNESVAEVHLQIDTDGKGVFDDTDRDYLISKNYSIKNATSLDDWYIVVDGKVNWNISINENGEFNPPKNTEDTENTSSGINIRVRAKDADSNESKIGLWSQPVKITIDDSNPKIGSHAPLRLVQYNDNNDYKSGEKAAMQYIPDMWIKGKWWLVGSVQDENGINEIVIEDTTESKINEIYKEETRIESDENHTDYIFYIPLDTTVMSEDKNSFSFGLHAKDNSEPEGKQTQTISIKYDNTAPELAEKLEYSGSDNEEAITQSNNAVEIASSVTESGSGFQRLAIYFKRTGKDGNHRIYNPVINKGEDGNGNRINIDDKVKIIDDLPRLTVTEATRTTGTIKHDSLINNPNIRKGGLVRIGGVERLITDVDSETGTVTFTPAVDESYKTAEFAYALVVDNFKVENATAWDDSGNPTEISNDDEDKVIESVAKTGATYNWTLAINSKNIPDGPINICYVAYDEAGNCSSLKEISTKVENNPPMIAKVWLGTDLDGNGTISRIDEVNSEESEEVEYTEEVEYRTDAKKSNSVSVNTTADGETLFTAKGNTTIRPEIVGGNGNLYYKVGNELKILRGTDENGKSGDGSILLEVNEEKLAGVEDGDKREFSFTIWDSTEECTLGVDTLDASLSVTMAVDVVDNIEPEVEIRDLFWNSETDNSLYNNSRNNGHIELSADLPKIFNGTGLMDTDDKVSGQVSFRGKASDDQRITAIYLAVDSFDLALDDSKKVGDTTYYKVATYTKGSWTTKDNWSEKGYKFAINSDKMTHTGHSVEWQLDIDTSKFDGVAALDKNIRLLVDDRRSTPNTATDNYRVDVVPYIAGIVRTGTTKSNTTTNRSTYGEYPIAVGDTIEVTGFNLGTGFKVGNTTVTGTETIATTKVYELSGITNSGELTVTVNNVTNLNASNNNSKSYNQDVGNAKWFDNRYLRVWDVDHYFRESTNANMPTMVTDNQGNLFSSWTDMGSATVQLERGLSNSSSPVYVCYDQTDKESWLSVDKSTLNGDLSVMYFPANVGWSGTPDTTGYAQAAAIGGVWGAGIPNAANIDYGNFANPKDEKGKRKYVRLPGNPLIKIDSKIEVAGWQLYSHSMRRDVSQFTNAKTVRKDKDMHFAYYDTKNKALRYTYQPVVDGLGETGWNDESRLRTISGWILIDGTFDGQDRLHTPGTYDIINASDSTNDIYSAVNEKSVVLKTANGNLPNTCTVGIAYTDSKGKYRLDLHEATVGNDKKTLTFNDGTTHNTSYTCMGGAVYYGDSNVVTSGDSRVNSAGSYLSLDVTSSGKPVIVYYDGDNETLRIAYSTSATPSMTNVANGRDTFTRQTISGVSGGTYVQAKIDPQNYLHIMYRDSDGQLCYIKSTNNPDGGAYTFSQSMVIETSGTYGTLSLMKVVTNNVTNYVPCVAFLNSEGTANGVKYSLLRNVDTGLRDVDTGAAKPEKLWDTMVVPAVVSGGENHYITGGELVYVEGKSGSWSVTEGGVNTADCDAIVGFNTGRMDVVFLKSEK